MTENENDEQLSQDGFERITGSHVDKKPKELSKLRFKYFRTLLSKNKTCLAKEYSCKYNNGIIILKYLEKNTVGKMRKMGCNIWRQKK